MLTPPNTVEETNQLYAGTNFWMRCPSRTSPTYRQPLESFQRQWGATNWPGAKLFSPPILARTSPFRLRMLTLGMSFSKKKLGTLPLQLRSSHAAYISGITLRSIII